VHDVGTVGKLEPGMVVTIEPGLYIREESLGIRIEDDAVVTDTGCLVITGAAPKKPEEVEAMMKQGARISVTCFRQNSSPQRRGAWHLPARRSRQNVNLFLREP